MVKRKSNPAKAFISKRQKNKKKKEMGEKFSARELAKKTSSLAMVTYRSQGSQLKDLLCSF